MKTFLMFVFLVYGICAFGSAELWDFKMVLDVPRVFDNSQSKGYRKYQKQTLKGQFTVEYKDGVGYEINFLSLANLNHKTGGKKVTYDVTVEDVLYWNGIGSNKKGVFDTRSVAFTLVCDPSYAIWEEPTEDNSLIITLGGKGKEGYVKGFVAGQLGCGCSEYGHVSPTRVWRTCIVSDVAGVYGKWLAKKRGYYCICR